ncbi:vegetative incompatibility protein HET-E-1 [Curvularia clavata]|uniref:Vegetative incompatibility protein HET-E-1 n=1 Tax=Curvularia clavata TaxID=95742 RepID=A0A9Q8Z222_CURCL|nr:vegetative incompatibility protein HET-E-1 [Curvularia clavata]
MAPEEPSHHCDALSRCQSLYEEITNFLAEETQCSVVPTCPDEAVQRAKTLVDSMTDAFHQLDLEIPVKQHGLWLDEQCKKYQVALKELLKFICDGRLRTETFNGAKIPQYAILSHTWKEGEEVTFADLKELDSTDTAVQSKQGWQKIRFCAQQAKRDGLEYFWVDTCCIDKANNTELSKAINSMFRWYQNAEKCYVFLADVDTLETDGEMAFRQSRWFSRGWTLQELLAPHSVEFFSKHGTRLGDKKSLQRIIHEVTSIPIEALSENDLSKFDVTHRFSWAANRQTTEEEDGAYCLFGIFNVTLPLIYGEGKERALKRLKKEIEEVSEDIGGGVTSSESLSREEKLSKICSWLSAPDPSANYQKAHNQRQAETGIWLLDSAEFTNWKKNAASRLWLYGIPGCGKTILSTTVVEHLLQHCQDDTMVTVYFYFDFKDAQKQDPELMLCSLLYQLLERLLSIPDYVDACFSSCENGNRRPPLHALLEVTRQTAQEFTHVYVVLDALDECTQRSELMPVLETLAGWRLNNLHLLMTSRKERDIEISLESYIKEEETICLQMQMVDQDIQRYVRQRLQSDRSLSKWNRDPTITQEIEAALMRGACGMFRWAVCQLDMLAKCRNLIMLRKSLATLPQTLDQTYDRILSAIREEDCVYAMRILQWLTFSIRPLTAQEVAEVVAIDVAREVAFDHNEVLIDPLEALDICSSLVTVTTNEVEEMSELPVRIIALAHYSVREYLVSDRIRRGPAKQYSMQETGSHKTIAEGCLKYIIQLEHPISRETYEASALARYAAEFWSRHVKNAGENTEQLNRLAMSLMDHAEPAYLSWIRLYHPEYPWQLPDLQRSLDGLRPPLYYAANFGLGELVKLLLDKGAGADVSGGFQDTALHIASIEGHEKVVKVLLDRGAEVDAESSIWGTALQAASLRNHEHVVKILLDHGAKVNMQSGHCGSALQAASAEGHERIVEVLLDKGAEVNMQSGYYGTALQAASAGGHERVAKILINRGADVNIHGAFHGSTIQAAAGKGHVHIIKVLLDKGAEVNTYSGTYGNAVNVAAYLGEIAVLKLLLMNVDIAQLQDPYGRSPLWWAAAGGWIEPVRILMDEYNQDPRIPDKFGRTPLDIATRKRNTAVWEILSQANGVVDSEQALLPPDSGDEWWPVMCNIALLEIIGMFAMISDDIDLYRITIAESIKYMAKILLNLPLGREASEDKTASNGYQGWTDFIVATRRGQRS